MIAFPPTFDVYLLKLDPAGTHVWSEQFGDPAVAECDECYGVAADPLGNVLLTGGYGNTIDFGLGPISSGDATSQDVFVAKLAP